MQMVIWGVVVGIMVMLFKNRNVISNYQLSHHVCRTKFPHNYDIDKHSPLHFANKGKPFTLKTCSKARKIGSSEPFDYTVEF